MTLPANLTALSTDELSTLLVMTVWEANLLIRALTLCGIQVDADLVDREDAFGLPWRPEFHVRAGEASWPPTA